MGGEKGTLVRALIRGGGRKKTPLAGETEAAINKTSLEMIPITCIVIVLGGWKDLGRRGYWGEPELMELRKEALDWGVSGHELERGSLGSVK